jgi:GNAT superfamily N-acetyltransferase
MDTSDKTLEQTDTVIVRNLRAPDLNAVIALDALITGRRREEFYKVKLRQALADTGITISLAAEMDAHMVGFLLARVYYGEFGITDKAAVMDAIVVHPDFVNQGVGSALIDQLRTNLLGLGIPHVKTEVGWEDQQLLRFCQRQGFTLAPRLCLDLDLERTRT